MIEALASGFCSLALLLEHHRAVASGDAHHMAARVERFLQGMVDAANHPGEPGAAGSAALSDVKILEPHGRENRVAENVSAPPEDSTAVEGWLETVILQAYEDLNGLSMGRTSPAIQDHKRTLTWVVRKLEGLRIRVLRQGILTRDVVAARPMVDAALLSLRTTHYLGHAEAVFLDYLVGVVEEDEEEEPEDYAGF